MTSEGLAGGSSEGCGWAMLLWTPTSPPGHKDGVNCNIDLSQYLFSGKSNPQAQEVNEGDNNTLPKGESDVAPPFQRA